jgi:hypothetical protein
MKHTRSEKLRSDKPSGRQASEQPEHSEEAPDSSTLHQGQGPDFPTQDSHLEKENPGIGLTRRQPAERKTSANQPQNPPETIQNDKKRDDD